MSSANKQPMMLELDTGVYWQCNCGQSANSFLCDGSHQGTDFTPTQFTISEKQEVASCGCKQSRNRPFCDGSHNQITTR